MVDGAGAGLMPSRCKCHAIVCAPAFVPCSMSSCRSFRIRSTTVGARARGLVCGRLDRGSKASIPPL